jgi:hypothetical protein
VFGPSLTEILILLNVAVIPLGGVPDNRPVPVSNAAQLGWPAIENIKVSPSGSLAVGTNVRRPRFDARHRHTGHDGRAIHGRASQIVNDGSGHHPSVTEIAASVNVGVRRRAPARPVVASNAPRLGDRDREGNRLAVGVACRGRERVRCVNHRCRQRAEIVGGRLLPLGWPTIRSNAGNKVCALPSGQMTMPRWMPTSATVGAPDNTPVRVNTAQVGFASIEDQRVAVGVGRGRHEEYEALD